LENWNDYILIKHKYDEAGALSRERSPLASNHSAGSTQKWQWLEATWQRADWPAVYGEAESPCSEHRHFRKGSPPDYTVLIEALENTLGYSNFLEKQNGKGPKRTSETRAMVYSASSEENKVRIRLDCRTTPDFPGGGATKEGRHGGTTCLC